MPMLRDERGAITPASVRLYYLTTPRDVINEDQRRWYEWQQEITRKPRARSEAFYFAKKNNIIKPPCVCGEAKVQMHHPDYDRPLEVGFLCAPCHRAEHRGRLQIAFKVYDLRAMGAEQGCGA